MEIPIWQRGNIACLPLLLLLAVFARPAAASGNEIAAERALLESQRLLDAGRPAAALAQLEEIIRDYTLHYAKRIDSIRIARSPQESMHYSLWGALEKRPMKVLFNGWAEALYRKSLAHAQLDERGAADAALAEALALAPQNSRFLLTWAERLASSGSSSAALAAFEAAEQAAELAPAELQALERASAIRGSAALLVRSGEVEQARSRLRKALAATPNDARINAALFELDQQRLADKTDVLF